jgi:catechol 2,3-dioxygenase-like lactoylglutathione lyase family enzyme
MRITGITFVGTRTGARPAMTTFVREVLGLAPVTAVDGMDADLFALPDGSSFAVASSVPPDEDDRTVGFLVDDLDDARRVLLASGVEVDDEISANERFRYLHFRAPDGHLYELVEDRRTSSGGG